MKKATLWYIAISLWLVACLSSILCAIEKPNVVLIFTDDQGIHDVGCYGSEIATPHIDSLARDGLKFTQWYAASSICTPSRFGLLTGRNPCRSQDELLGALMFLSDEDKTRGIQPGETTIAELLSKTGYQTALIGKWHLGHGDKRFLPTRHGFNTFYGHTGGCVDFFTMRYGNTPDWYRNEEHVDVTGYATEVITKEATEFLESQSNDGQPFFLYLSYNAPHFGKGWNDGEGKTVNQLQPPPADLARVAHIENITRRKYAAKVVNLDDAVGRILRTLDEQNLAEETLVIFITDHGGDPTYGGANLPFRGGKATLFEGGIRVPCLMRWPATIKPGSECHEILWSIDLTPTLSQLCQAPQTSLPFDGINFSRLLHSEEWKPPKRNLYWQLGKHDLLQRGNWIALRNGNWKYIQDDHDREYVFDIQLDPYEKNNLLSHRGKRSAELNEFFLELSTRAQALGKEYNESQTVTD